MSYLHFTVAGTPAPQGSKRYLGQHGGKGITVESSKRVAPWRADVRDAAMKARDTLDDDYAARLWDGPVAVTITFTFARPKSHYRTGRNAHLLRDQAPAHPAGKPDLDKLVRAVSDALTGMVFRDDAQVVIWRARKAYGPPGADVLIGVAP